MLTSSTYEGILPVCKPEGKTSFHLVAVLRRLTGVRTIGHAGTLDPFASGVMVLLIGRRFTKLSSHFLHQDKEYLATIRLGVSTNTYDIEGEVTSRSESVPSLAEVEEALLEFQGTILQTPPMFCAKKVEGTPLYQLARKGVVIEREPVKVTLRCTLVEYVYPHVVLTISCSKGTYIRSLAHDLGSLLGCGAHLGSLIRTRSGSITLEECCDGSKLFEPTYPWVSFLKQEVPLASCYRS